MNVFEIKKLKMASEELVTEQFQFLNIDLSPEVIKKCVRMCEEYNIDAETFVEQWLAFSLSHLNGSEPNLDNLDALERKEFSKLPIKGIGHIPHVEEIARSNAGSNNYYKPSTSIQANHDVLSNYVTLSPKEESQSLNQRNDSYPGLSSPNISHSAKYQSRKNAGAVVCSYGENSLAERLDRCNGPEDMFNFEITQVPNEDGVLYETAKFGFELLHEKATTFDRHIHKISRCIMNKVNIKDLASVRHKTQIEVAVAGRIECDADARLNPKCVVLQGTWEESLSQAVPVNIDNLKQYSLFSGQVVVMKGTNPRGDEFVADQVYYDAAIPTAKQGDSVDLKGTLSLVIAAGPYTTSDNLAYEPLKDLIGYIVKHKPHVVIMTGPFVDCDHKMFKDNILDETYGSFFGKIVDSLGELNTSCPFTRIYIVSSYKDMFHVNMYPSPAHRVRRSPPNVHFLPDPSTISVGGVALAVTSTDVLMHITQEEISLGMSGDKLSRAAAHLLWQRSLFPVWPTTTVPLDVELWAAHAQLSVAPSLMVVPSQLRYFIKDVDGCVVINPERMTKGTNGGTFARVLITNGQGSPNIAAQILRI